MTIKLLYTLQYTQIKVFRAPFVIPANKSNREMEEIGMIGCGRNTATREEYVGDKLLAGWEERMQRRIPSR